MSAPDHRKFIFGDAAFTEMAREGHRRTDRLAVEDRARRLSEELMPLFDRANRMMIRNLKAIKELRQGQVPAIAGRVPLDVEKC